jgi:hypothetical protein
VGLGQALINRWGTDTALRFVDKRRDGERLQATVMAAARATDEDRHCRAVFGRYDINPGFFEHEGLMRSPS